MPQKIVISPELRLPLDIVTQTIALLAKRRAGKSYTARQIVEQLFRAGQQVVIVDPKGDWYGIRSSADGRKPGLPIVILGGEHGDVPLERDSGEIVAKLVVEERVSVLLDLSLFRKREVATFMAAFLEQLYRLKARDAFRTPLMLVIDEADAIAPQKAFTGEERMLGAAEDIVRRGGQRGIGCTLITQRSAVLNKNVLTQAQVLVALRTIAPQDLAALDAWIDVHGTPEERKELMESLPSLPVGEAWFWSPGWPTVQGIFKRVKVTPIQTFDSGSTPRPGEKRIAPKNLADVDLEALSRQMAGTIERAKADDPKELRKRIAELERELKKKAAAAAPVIDQVAIDRAVERAVKEAVASRDRQLLQLRGIFGKAAEILALKVSEGSPQEPGPKARLEAARAKAARVAAPARTIERAPTKLPARPAGDYQLGPSERVVLATIAQFPSGATRQRIAVSSGRSLKSSTFQSTFPALEAAGLIRKSGDRYEATDEGHSIAGTPPLPTGPELLEHWMGKLGPSEAKVLGAIARAYPRRITRDAIAEETGHSTKSSTFQSTFPALRAFELIEGRSDFRLSDDLAGGQS